MLKYEEFMKLLDIVEEFNEVTNGYFPTVEELKAHKVEEHINEFLPILAYFASNPFERMGIDKKDDARYKETVSYCKRLAYQVEIEN